jgi:hypothetical protein
VRGRNKPHRNTTFIKKAYYPLYDRVKITVIINGLLVTAYLVILAEYTLQVTMTEKHVTDSIRSTDDRLLALVDTNRTDVKARVGLTIT